MATAEIKRSVLQGFQANGLFLDREALTVLADYVAALQDTEDIVPKLLDAYQADESSKINKAAATALVDKLSGGDKDVDFVQVINAFEIPRIKFDPIRKAFYREDGSPTLFGDAQDKRQVYLERLYVLQQRLARNPLFSKPVFGSIASKSFVEVTEIKALLGNVGETKTVLGFISQVEDGRYHIEDLSGSLPIDLSEALTAAGFYVENCIVAAEGKLQHNGKFKVAALGMPPNEKPEDSLIAAKGLDFFGGVPLKGDEIVTALEWEAEHEDDRIIFLSDIWLDNPSCLASLEAVLAGFESLESVPSMFVLMGNFHSFSCSAASTDYAAVKDSFTALGNLLAKHSRIMEMSRMVLVPGPGDPGPSAILPRPQLPVTLTKELREAVPNAVFASNPCRIRYYSQHLIVFRDDLQKRMRRLCLRPPVEGDDSKASDISAADRMFEHLCMTVTQQSHLCPVPLDNQGVYWQLDHAMRVYPLPNVLVLADSAPAADFKERKSGCVCINPGSVRSRTFAAYKPSTSESELCEIPDQ